MTPEAQNKSVSTEGAGKEARGEQVTQPWKLPNYNGPMTIEIATFRNARYEIKDGKVVPRKGYEIDKKTGVAVKSKTEKTVE